MPQTIKNSVSPVYKFVGTKAGNQEGSVEDGTEIINIKAKGATTEEMLSRFGKSSYSVRRFDTLYGIMETVNETVKNQLIKTALPHVAEIIKVN